MNSEQLAKLRECCRDDTAFEQLQQILAIAPPSPSPPLSEIGLTGALPQMQYQLERQKALAKVISRIRESLELETIFQATATEVRQLLSADRVAMFRFYPDSGWNDGEFVSEDVHPDFSSAMLARVHDDCFGDQYAIHYQKGRIQAVSDIYAAGLSDCHIAILAQFQVKANLAVPLLQGKKLWGLLCIHQCREPRSWHSTDIEFVTQIANHLGIVLQQAELLADLRAEVQQRQQAEQAVRSLNQELRKSVLELKVVNKELEAFSYSVSHDLRAPLRSIDGFSQALLEDYFSTIDATGQDYLRRIRAATQRMGQLIDELLNLSRVMRSEMRRESVDLSAIARAIVLDLQQSDPTRSVIFLIQDGLVVQGDPRLLQVVLTNLLENAWKFTSKQAQAQVEFSSTIQENGSNLYLIKDNGAGFDMAYVSKLFGAFQRLHAMHEFPGNGIGLATVQRIIHRHGGQVWATGAIGQGATVYFTLGS